MAEGLLVVELRPARLLKRIVTVRTDCLNQDGEAVLKGEATVLLDPLG